MQDMPNWERFIESVKRVYGDGTGGKGKIPLSDRDKKRIKRKARIPPQKSRW